MEENWYVPSALLSVTPGEPKKSSAVLKSESAPGFLALELPTAVRGSEPPLVAMWHVPHATVRVEESCSSQKRALPNAAFAAVTALPAGAFGGLSAGNGPGFTA